MTSRGLPWRAGRPESPRWPYDTRGNIISEKRGNLTTTYAYDALGQLIRVNDPHENATWAYSYDRGGNILSKAKYAYTTGALALVVETHSAGLRRCELGRIS